MFPTCVYEKIKTRLYEEPYLGRLSLTCVCSKNPTTDDVCKRVCVKKHSADACAVQASIVRILLQTMFVKASVVSSIQQTRVLYTRL